MGDISKECWGTANQQPILSTGNGLLTARSPTSFHPHFDWTSITFTCVHVSELQVESGRVGPDWLDWGPVCDNRPPFRPVQPPPRCKVLDSWGNHPCHCLPSFDQPPSYPRLSSLIQSASRYDHGRSNPRGGTHLVLSDRSDRPEALTIRFKWGICRPFFIVKYQHSGCGMWAAATVVILSSAV